MSDSAKYKKRTFVGTITALIYLAIVAAVAFASLYQGISQFYADASKTSRSESSASEAVRFDPASPDAYKTRGELFASNDNYEAAARDFESAVNLRPTDYVLWLRLGYAHYKQRNFAEAEKAYERAVELAPNYAQPKWYIGWLHLRQENYDRAFDYLNQAADINSEYLPELLDLVRTTFADRDVDELIKPKSLAARKTTASYFIEYNIASKRNETFLTGEELSDYHKNTYVSRLLAGKNFSLAHAVWISKRANKNLILSEDNRILNGDFEDNIDSSEEGFGWRISQKTENVDFAVDEQNAYAGSKLLEIEFEGSSSPEELILSQLVLVEPNQNYRLTFAAAASELTSGGLPIVTVTDAASGKTIGQSSALASTNGRWQKHSIEVRTGDATKAVLIGVRRNPCDSSLCPAFGFLRLDGFELKNY